MWFKKIMISLGMLGFVKSLQNSWIMAEVYGQRISMNKSRCLDKSGNEIPWYTYPAYEYLKSLDFKNLDVLEFGSGASSSWWAKHAKSVLAIEHNKDWFGIVKNRQKDNLEIVLAETEEAYLKYASGRKFNVIIIDGIFRYQCAIAIKDMMNEGALIILDNSDWYPITAKFLRESYNLLQVDMHGFGPINNYTWTTSLFFSRSFNCLPNSDRLPSYSAGAIKQLEE